MLRVPDRYDRPLRNLRLSVTDRCNLRCSYCMPEAEYVWLPKADVLTYEEMHRIVRVFVGLGVDKVRLTGGEPLLRTDVEKLVRMLAAEPGEVATQLTVQGVPRIVRVATAYLTPLLEPYLSRKDAADLVEVLARMVISYFLAPSSRFDFTNEHQARAFVRAHVPFTQGAMK